MRTSTFRPVAMTTATAMLIAIAGTTASAEPRVPAPATATESTAVSSADITPVTDASGNVVGYAVPHETQVQLAALAQEMDSLASGGDDPAVAGTDDVWQVAQCSAAIAAFVALTVFPTARAAKVAVRLGQMVNKYGLKTTAQILTRTYKGKDIDAEKIFWDFAKQAAGIGALSVCFE